MASMSLLSAALLLFLVLDPVGNIPVFLTTLKAVEPERQVRVVLRELVIALVVLVLFLFAGRYILTALQISEPSLTIAGGILLFMIAIRMVFPGRGASVESELEGEPLIVPLAIPFIAGPSAMASVMLIMNRQPERWPEWLIALLLAWSATGAILLAASTLRRHLGERGLIAMERLMGMVLTTLAVQMLMSGAADFLASLP